MTYWLTSAVSPHKSPNSKEMCCIVKTERFLSLSTDKLWSRVEVLPTNLTGECRSGLCSQNYKQTEGEVNLLCLYHFWDTENVAVEVNKCNQYYKSKDCHSIMLYFISTWYTSLLAKWLKMSWNSRLRNMYFIQTILIQHVFLNGNIPLTAGPVLITIICTLAASQ